LQLPWIQNGLPMSKRSVIKTLENSTTWTLNPSITSMPKLRMPMRKLWMLKKMKKIIRLWTWRMNRTRKHKRKLIQRRMVSMSSYNSKTLELPLKTQSIPPSQNWPKIQWRDTINTTHMMMRISQLRISQINKRDLIVNSVKMPGMNMS
jgi:hypothetical protein